LGVSFWCARRPIWHSMADQLRETSLRAASSVGAFPAAGIGYLHV
jgi:hypothetical protein